MDSSTSLCLCLCLCLVLVACCVGTATGTGYLNCGKVAVPVDAPLPKTTPATHSPGGGANVLT